MGRRPGRAERAAGDVGVPARLGERARQVARDLAGPAAREEHQRRHDARHGPDATRARGWRLPAPGGALDDPGTLPPSTDHAAPVTFDARSEQRNTIAAAISSSVPKRPERRLGRRGLEHLLAGAARARRDLVGQAALAGPRARSPPGPARPRSRARRGRVASANSAAEREQGGLRDRVGGVASSEGRLPDDEHTFTIRPPPASAIARRERAHQAQRGHHVELPLLLPVGVGRARRAGAAGSCRRC